ncbi:hypothetical protein NLJ89_g11241 [Agrocybe chaxingu]|uniref:F-box domain-containing protein n=1 Tax=Agrocybe chaxingu TaxID=84603 RepID=A0A9W8JPR1_9AGAR|nr:hypothetical protein NLJ89_g11241 [Agrocybe chaxingu]
MVTSMFLGSVCRRWREIAEATPRLWTSISINAHRSDMEEYVPFVAACLSRSGALPLTLAIYDHKDDYAPKAPDHNKDLVEPHKEAAPIIKVVNANSSRWKSLSIFVPISVLRQLWCDSRRAPALETLCIHAFPSDPNADFLIFNKHKTCIPSPKSLLLSSIRPHMIRIRWDNVDNVDLNNVSKLDVRAMFSCAPKMTSFSIRSLHVDNGNLLFDPIMHHALCKLNLATSWNIDEILNSITVPSLQDLSVMSLSSGLMSMISRSRPPLTHLTIRDVITVDDALIFFKETPLLTNLRLIDVLLPTNFFRLLSTTSTRAAADSEAFLPALSSLTISTALEPDWTDVADMLDTEGVEAVHATRRPLSRFVFRLIGGKLHRDSDSDEGVNPTDSPTLQRLLALKDSGLSLLIMDGRGCDLLAKGQKYIGLNDNEDE